MGPSGREIRDSSLTEACKKDVLITGFGKFLVKQKAKRKGRNPATGDDLMLRPRKIVTFQCMGKLREKINEN